MYPRELKHEQFGGRTGALTSCPSPLNPALHQNQLGVKPMTRQRN